MTEHVSIQMLNKNIQSRRDHQNISSDSHFIQK